MRHAQLYKHVFLPLRAITLENTLVILSTVALDAGTYYVQAVNDKNGDNKTSQPITLSVASKCHLGGGGGPVLAGLLCLPGE